MPYQSEPRPMTLFVLAAPSRSETAWHLAVRKLSSQLCARCSYTFGLPCCEPRCAGLQQLPGQCAKPDMEQATAHWTERKQATSRHGADVGMNEFNVQQQTLSVHDVWFKESKAVVTTSDTRPCHSSGVCKLGHDRQLLARQFAQCTGRPSEGHDAVER